MLPRPHRLAKSKEVKSAISKGRGFFHPLLTVKFKPGGNLSRFTVVVSTKVSKKAVIRNRIKRVIREVLRLHRAGFRPGDYAILIKPSAGMASADELRSAMFGVARKSGFYFQPVASRSA